MHDIATSPQPAPRDWLAQIRPAIRTLEPSGIVEVVDFGRGRQGLIPLWVGEGDRPTPDFIVQAAKASLDRGETFYTYQSGIPPLREAIARYVAGVYGPAPGGGDFSPERFFVTIGGMHALDIAVRMTVGSGRGGAGALSGLAEFRRRARAPTARALFSCRSTAASAGRLDAGRLAAAVTPATRAILFNSPANPTGYVATREELVAVLDLARRRDLWIIADEIYGRLTYGERRAPSFHDVMAPDDKILFVQTLSKNWAMTGWRIGWLEAPPALAPAVENLIQYSTSGVPVATQRAAIAALDQGESFFGDTRARMRASRDHLADALKATGRVRFSLPEGAFYLFCTDRRRARLAPARLSPDRGGRCRRRPGLRLRPRRRGLSPDLLRRLGRGHIGGDAPPGGLAADLKP